MICPYRRQKQSEVREKVSFVDQSHWQNTICNSNGCAHVLYRTIDLVQPTQNKKKKMSRGIVTIRWLIVMVSQKLRNFVFTSPLLHISHCIYSPYVFVSDVHCAVHVSCCKVELGHQECRNLSVASHSMRCNGALVYEHNGVNKKINSFRFVAKVFGLNVHSFRRQWHIDIIVIIHQTQYFIHSFIYISSSFVCLQSGVSCSELTITVSCEYYKKQTNCVFNTIG